MATELQIFHPSYLRCKCGGGPVPNIGHPDSAPDDWARMQHTRDAYADEGVSAILSLFRTTAQLIPINAQLIVFFVSMDLSMCGNCRVQLR